MSETVDEHAGFDMTYGALTCERCHKRPPGFQLTGIHGYVQLCVACLGHLADEAENHLSRKAKRS